MEKQTGREVAERPWCDVNLTEILWVNDGRDFVLKWNLHNNQRGILKCSWVHSIVINLVTSENEGGFLLTFDAKFQQQPQGWEVEFNFASKGAIVFNCNELFLQTEKN
jgi:hypothetical protein